MPTKEDFQGVSNCYVFKSRLQKYAQKTGLSTPVYETIKEGPLNEPSFRSTVMVNDVCYDSLPGFYNRKAAEHSAAEVALVELAKSSEVNQSNALLICHSTIIVFKSRLHEYAQKAGLSTPVYETIKEGPPHEPSFRSTVMVNDVRYDSLPGFFNRKAAEQSAAEVALVELAKSGVSNCYVSKSRLQEYAQKEGLSTPVYETIKEGPLHEPSFRSTVIVNDVRYDSLPGFFNRKAAEHSAAEVALVELAKSGEVNQSIAQPVQETGLCKNLLQEYAQKMNYAMPMYHCKMDETPGRTPLFSCTIDIGGVLYIGGSAKTKKEAEIKAARTALLAIQSNLSDASENQLGNNLTVIPCRKRARKSSKRKPSKDKIVRAIHADNVGIGANINHGVEESHANVNDESSVQEITSEAAFASEAMKSFEDGVSTNHQEKETLAGEHSFALNDQGIFETGKSTEFQPKEDNLGTVAIEVSSVPDGDNGEWAAR